MKNDSNDPNLLIVGGGNMGSAIAKGLLDQLYQPDNLAFIDQSPERLVKLDAMFPGCHTSTSYEEIDRCNIYLLAVKPDQLKSACEALVTSNHVHTDAVYISIAAGVTTKSLHLWLGENMSIIRCMPNTPAALKLGATGLYCRPCVSEYHRRLADEILRTVGITVWLNEEKLLDTVTALSGSGPAYFFYFMECMIESATKLGLSETASIELIKQTALGASQLASQSASSLAQLRAQVTSKGGTTEHAIESLQKDGLSDTVHNAISAAAKRAAQISLEFK